MSQFIEPAGKPKGRISALKYVKYSVLPHLNLMRSESSLGNNTILGVLSLPENCSSLCSVIYLQGSILLYLHVRNFQLYCQCHGRLDPPKVLCVTVKLRIIEQFDKLKSVLWRGGVVHDEWHEQCRGRRSATVPRVVFYCKERQI